MRSQCDVQPVHLWRDGEWGAIRADDVEGFGGGGGGRVDGAVVAGAVVGATTGDCRGTFLIGCHQGARGFIAHPLLLVITLL